MKDNVRTTTWSRLARRIAGIACVAGSVASFTLSTDVFAAPAPAVPGSANAGRMLENLNPVPEPTLTAPPVEVAPQVGVPAPPGAGSTLFLFKKVALVGATAYDRKELEDMLEDIFKPYVNQYMSVRKLYELVGNVTRRYHDDGYALSKAVVPPQNLTDGKVRIQVVEGYIDEVETQGAHRHSEIVDTIIDRIRSYRPLRMQDLEHELLLLNDLPGVSVRGVLKPPAQTGKTALTPGATDLLLVFTDAAVAPSASVDNYGSRYFGPYEASFRAGANSDVILPYQQTVVTGATALPQSHQLQNIQVSHRLMLNAEGTTATLQAGYVHTEPGYQLTSTELNSDAYSYGVGVSHPLVRSRERNVYLGGDLTIKDITTDALDTRLYHDRLTIASVAGNVDAMDRWGGANAAQVKLSQGLNALGATQTGSTDLSRADGHSDFTRVTATAGRLQPITSDVQVYAAATGQYSWSPLLSSEQFGYGGQQFGRAYDASELTGDNGVAGMVEVRHSLPTTIPNANTELYGFYDIGRVWDYNDTGSMEGGSSAGVGVRFQIGKHVSANLSLAKPLTRKVAAPEYGRGKSPRAFFSLDFKE